MACDHASHPIGMTGGYRQPLCPILKMKTILIISILFGTFNCAFSQNDNRWFIEKKNKQIGYIDSTGKEIFLDKFDILDSEFHSGLVFFQKGKKRGFLDINGATVFSSKYLWGHFSEGLLPYKDKTGFYYLNTKGEKAIDIQKLKMPKGKEVSEIFQFKYGLAMIRIKDIGFNDFDDGNSCISFAENVNLYPGNWLYGFIDKSGKWSIEPELESATTFNDSISIVEQNNKTYFLTTCGNFIFIQNKNVKEFSEGFAIEYTDDGCYFVNRQGERVGNSSFQRANPFSDGMAAVQIGDKWGFIDTTGTIMIAPKYYVRSDFSEGLAAVSLESDTISNGGSFIEAFIDKTGQEVIPFKRNIDYGKFQNGIAKGRRFIYSDGRYTGYYELFYINKKDEKIWSEIIKQ